jgi:hypothetical protein
VRHRTSTASTTASALLLGALAVVAGCGNNPDKGDCVHTSLALKPAHLTSQTAPLKLHARLTGDGKPLARFRLSFFLVFTGPTRLVGTSGKLPNLSGYATTDAAGNATFELGGGPADIALPGERAIGYQVRFTIAKPVDHQEYCGSFAESTFT